MSVIDIAGITMKRMKCRWPATMSMYLGDNDQGCEGVVRPAPEGAGRMMQSKPERSEGFDVIIRPAPEGAGRTTPEQPGHYPHYNTKLTVSREIAQIQYQNRLLLLRRAAILFTFLLPFPQVNPTPPFRNLHFLLCDQTSELQVALLSDVETTENTLWVHCVTVITSAKNKF